MNPKISDFGLARIFGGNQTEANTNRVVGTFGYMAPEYALNGKFSEKSDVFSFGVLLIEVVSGRKDTGLYPSKHSIYLLGNAWHLWREGTGMERLDPVCKDSSVAQQVLKCINVGLLCVQEDVNDRPTMNSVISMLGSDSTNLPDPKMPAFSDRSSNTVGSSAPVAASYSINQVTLTTIAPR